MDIAVLGGSGNLSTPVVERLLALGHHVTVVHRGLHPPPPGCRDLVADRKDPGALAAVLAERWFDAVIDFLAFTADDCAAVHAAIAGRTGQYVLISSATVYRKPHRIPVVEDDPKGNAHSAYAQAKLAAEDWCRERHGTGFRVTIVRPSHTFGERWIPSPLSGSDFTVARRILDGRPILLHDQGRNAWALTAAEDFAAGLCGLVGNPAALGEDFHITTDEALSWNGIYDELGRILGRPPAVVHIPTAFLAEQDPTAGEKLLGDKAHQGLFDNRKVKRVLPDFACRWRLREALRRSVAWFLAEPSRQRVDPEADRRIDRLIAAWRSAEGSWAEPG